MTILSCVLSLLLVLSLSSSAMGVTKSKKMQPENYAQLQAYLAESSLTILESIPDFKPGYKEQEGKLDATGQALISHLKQHMPYPFKSQAGDSMVDVVQFADSSEKTAYVFIILKNTDTFTKTTNTNMEFFYDFSPVVDALESFILSSTDLDKVLYIYRGTGYFMFGVQKK